MSFFIGLFSEYTLSSPYLPFTCNLHACVRCFRIVYEFSEDEEAEVEQVDVQPGCFRSLSHWQSYMAIDTRCLASPLPLTMICRSVIRESITRCNGAARVKSIISSLPLPQPIRCFLAFVDVPTDRILR